MQNILFALGPETQGQEGTSGQRFVCTTPARLDHGSKKEGKGTFPCLLSILAMDTMSFLCDEIDIRQGVPDLDELGSEAVLF